MAIDQPQSYVPLPTAEDTHHDQITDDTVISPGIEEPVSPLQRTDTAATIPRPAAQRQSFRLSGW